MSKAKPTYQQLEKRLAEIEPVIEALKNHEVDAVVGEGKIAFLLLKEVEEALVASEKEFRALFDLSGIGMAQAEAPDFHFTRVNPKLCAMTGHSAKELLTKTWIELTHPEDRPKDMKELTRVLRGKADWWSIEKRCVRKDGSIFWVHVNGAAMRDGAGRVVKIAAMIEDVTARKEVEDALHEAAVELERSNQDLEQFAHVASHDLQEPLRMVTGFLKLLESKYGPQLDAKAREYIAFSVDGATRMSQLIIDLLMYGRVDRKGKRLEAVDANRPLAAALANLHGSIREAGATVTQEELPPIVGDISQLTQLFQNLIGNAVKFRHPDRPCQVHVSARQEKGNWVFAVRDNGIGIPPEQFERVFVIFQRLHTRDKYAGTGIGLAICRRIVERHGGRTWVESNPGEGSTFFFAL